MGFELTKEIIGKARNMSYENLDLQNGGHIATLHVGMSNEKLLKRMKEERKNISTFESKNDVSVCLWEFFTDEYNVKKALAKWLDNMGASEREGFNYFTSEQTGNIGRVVLPNGGIRRTDCFRIILQKMPLGERDITTGMPFVVISMYPIMEE